MNSPKTFHHLVVLAIVFVCMVQLGGPNSPQVQSAAKEPTQPAAATTQPTEKDFHDLEVRYAKVFDGLARVNLRAATDLNDKIPNMFSVTYINRLKELVTVADDRLDALKSGAPMGNVRLIRAKIELSIAERNLQRALDANKQSAGTMSGSAVEKLQLHRELAQINLDRAKMAADSPSPMVDMQWQLDRLQDTVWELRSSIDNITSRR